MLGDVGIDFTGEIKELDPVAFLEELPETTGDPVFLGILDRADAYALVVQQSDPQTRHAVALACIKSGIARQAIERLRSVDKRLAYEAFATLAVLASSNEIATILEAMGQSDEMLAIAATRVLGAAGFPDSLPALRQMAVRDAISENLRTAILEVIYKIDQNQPV